MSDALDAAELLLSAEIDRRFGKVLHEPHKLAAAVVTAYLDALDPAEVAMAASGDLVDWTAAVLRAIRPRPAASATEQEQP